MFNNQALRRVAAAVADLCIVFIAAYALAFVSYFAGVDVEQLNSLTVWIILVGLPLYHVVNNTLSRSSLGKTMFGLAIYDTKHGSKLLLWQSIARSMLLLLEIVIAPVSVLIIAMSGGRRRIADYMVGTFVASKHT